MCYYDQLYDGIHQGAVLKEKKWTRKSKRKQSGNSMMLGIDINNAVSTVTMKGSYQQCYFVIYCCIYLVNNHR